MTPDPKWLDILKASGWKTGAITFAAALLLYGNAKRLFPLSLEPWVVETLIVVGVACACLTLASLGSATVKVYKPQSKLARLVAIRRAKHQVAKGIPHMTPKEREIVGYLLAKNQRMFTNTPDCGEANTLVSKGIVVCAVRPGQSCTYYEVPFEVPEHIWHVLVAHREDFPYNELETDQPHPWRAHWMSP